MNAPADGAEGDGDDQRTPGVDLEARGRAAARGQPRREHGGERHHRFDREIHVARDDAERQADRDQADEGRVLQDVEEDAELEEMLDRQ